MNPFWLVLIIGMSIAILSDKTAREVVLAVVVYFIAFLWILMCVAGFAEMIFGGGI
jgi:hypothetical protein